MRMEITPVGSGCQEIYTTYSVTVAVLTLGAIMIDSIGLKSDLVCPVEQGESTWDEINL